MYAIFKDFPLENGGFVPRQTGQIYEKLTDAKSEIQRLCTENPGVRYRIFYDAGSLMIHMQPRPYATGMMKEEF